MERDREKIHIKREVLSLEGKEESWTASMSRMGKFITQGGEERRDERVPTLSCILCLIIRFFFLKSHRTVIKSD